MSAIAHPIWSPKNFGFSQTQTSFNERVYQVFSQKEMAVSVVYQYYRTFAGSVIETVRTRGKEAAFDPTKKWVVFTKKFFADLVDHYVADGIAKFKSQSDYGPIKDIVLRSGLKELVFYNCILEAKKVADSFFCHDICFSRVQLNQCVDYWADTNTRMVIMHLQEAYGYKQIGSRLEFSDADIEKFGLSKESVTQNPATMSCFAYALFHVEELEARHCIFKNERSLELIHLLDLLTKWNYYSVAMPDKGDLVAYINDQGKAAHLAVFVEDDIVHSKPGDRSPYAYNHKMFHVGFEYGNKVVFFRKGPELN